jgi:hypothetical protein
MSVWARSDLASVSVSAAHGGCGEVHTRPAPGGIPVQPWRLDCETCANYLRSDAHWSATSAEIPETHDEGKTREDFQKRGAHDKDAIMTLALARLAGIPTSELPESLTRMISGRPAHIPGVLECPAGHGNPAGQKFCGQCGAPMSGPVPQASLPPAPERPAAARPGQRPRRLRDARLDELQALARSRGLSVAGTRADLISRLADAGITSAALSTAAA